VIRLFSLMPGNPLLAQHRAAGGLCYEVLDGQLTETTAGERRSLLAVADLPGAFGGRAAHVVANALAAVAACRALGVTAKDIARGLAAFDPAAGNPGRSSFFRVGANPVIVDYGHNAAALEATGRFLREVFGTAPVAAVTLPGDRQDDLLVQAARAVAAWFGPVVIYEDSDKRGRETGAMITLIDAALRAARPGITVQHAENPADALRAALRLAGGGPVLFVYEKLALARDALAAVGAEPWPEAEATPRPSAASTGRARGAGGRYRPDGADHAEAADRPDRRPGLDGSDPDVAGAAVAAAAAVVRFAAAAAACEGVAVAGADARDGSADYETLTALGDRQALGPRPPA
jgi:cyanophycin synthetase